MVQKYMCTLTVHDAKQAIGSKDLGDGPLPTKVAAKRQHQVSAAGLSLGDKLPLERDPDLKFVEGLRLPWRNHQAYGCSDTG
jgi:hypothetical protein